MQIGKRVNNVNAEKRKLNLRHLRLLILRVNISCFKAAKVTQKTANVK